MTSLDVRRIITTLVDHDVRFVVVGMGAAVLQGAPATTVDIDVVLLPVMDNYEALAAALNDLGARRSLIDAGPPIEDRDLLGESIKQFTTDAGPVDVLPELIGVGTYDVVADRAMTMQLQGREFLVASLDDILSSKRASDRPKDHAAMPVLLATLAARDRGTEPR